MEPRPTIESFALIIGAMKSGTTSLFEYLGQHPQIAPCSSKEPDFFTDDTKWRRGLSWYESLWDWDPARHRVALEASTSYTKRPNFPNAAERIAQLDRRVRLIYIMRDPVERFESHLNHNLRKGRLQRDQDIEEHTHLLEVSRYAFQLAPYFERFDAEDILLLDFNDLKNKPERLIASVVDFLGLDASASFDTAARHNVSARQVREHQVWRRLKRIKWLERLAVKLVPRELRSRLRSVVSEKVRRRRLNAAEREYLRAHLRDDIKRLEVEYGFETSGWTSHSSPSL
jgi:hypothetical protein